MPVVINEISTNGSSNGSSQGSANGNGGASPGTIEGIHLSHFALKISGAQAPNDVLDSIIECMVENSLHLPDMCILRFEAASADSVAGVGFPAWVDDATFDIGKEIEIDAFGEGQQPKPIFYGEITAVEMDFSAIGVPTLIVRALAFSHRLTRTRQRRSFAQVTDSDIVSKLAGEAGLSADADSTANVYDWVFQNNQTDWDFLQDRARRNSFWLYAWNKTLSFKKIKEATSADVAVEWGNDLRSFRPSLNAGSQVTEVQVRGWDRKKKQTIIGQNSSPKSAPTIGAKTAKAAGASFSNASKMTVVDKPTFSQGEADKIAQSVFDDIAGEYVEADGLTFGNPNLLAGKTIEVKGVGQRFSGKYFVTSTTHTYTAAEGYTTQFSINGKRPGNLLALLENESKAVPVQAAATIVVAIVTNINDPEDMARVKVKYPTITEDDESFWAPVAMPMAGPGRGFQYIPEVNDEVLVAFENGDIHRPYVIGALWNGSDKPPMKTSEYVKDSKIIRRLTKTRIGHTMDFDDDASSIKITTAGSHKYTMLDASGTKSVGIETSGKHQIFADDDWKGESGITLFTTKKNRIFLIDNRNGADPGIMIRDQNDNYIQLNATDNSITVNCKGALNISAGGKITMEGKMGIDIKSPAPITIHSDAKLDMDATGPTSVKGAVVQIN